MGKDLGTAMTHPPRLRACFLLIAGMAVVGAYVAFSKVLVATVPVFLLATIRFAIAALVMLPWTFPRGGWAVARAQARTLFLQSLFGNFLFSICMLSGVARTSATAAGLIMSMLPAVVALLSLIALRERLSGRTLCAIALAVIGVASLVLVRADSSGAAADAAVNAATQRLGNLLMVGAVFCEALYVILGKRLTSASLEPMQISAWINLVGLALIAPLGLLQAAHFDFASITPALWLLIGVYAIAASIVSTWLWLSGLKHVPASEAGVFTIALPVTSALVGIAFLGESLTRAHGIAFACAVAGVTLMTRKQPHRPLPRA